MEIKWPHQLTVVDVPSKKSARYRSSNSSNLLELVSAEIISSCDPRLSPNLSPTSVYAHMDFDYGNISLQRSDRNVHGLADDDWLLENIGDAYKEMAKNLKVRVHINPKFLPILADRAALSKRDSVVTVHRSDPLSEGHDTFAKMNEKSAATSSLVKNKEQCLTIDKTDKLRMQQLKGSSNAKLGDASSENLEDQSIQLVSKPNNLHEKGTQMQIGVNDKIGAVQNEPTTKSCSGNLAADLSTECFLRGLQNVQSLRPEDICSKESSLSDCVAVVKIEKDSSENELFGRLASEEVKATSSGVVNQGNATIGIKNQAQKSVGQKFVNAVGITGNCGTVITSAFSKKPDKQKLKEEVLLLERMVAEKKAQQEERENREKLGIRVASKDRPQQKILKNEDKELRNPLQKSTSAERLYHKHALVEKHATADKAISKKHCIPADEKHKVKTRLEHFENKASNVSCFSRAEEKIVEDVVKCVELGNERNNAPLEKRSSITSNPASVKELDGVRTDDEFKLPVLDQPVKQPSKTQTINPLSKSDSKFSHHLDGEEEVYKESKIKQPIATRPNTGFNQSENFVIDKVIVAKSIEKLDGSKFCTCGRLKLNDNKSCDTCLEKLSSAISEPPARTLSMLSSHSANFTSSDLSVHSAGQKSEMITDAALSDVVSNAQDVLPVKNLEVTTAENDEPVLMHLSCLSPETQFESQFYDCFSVRRIHLEVIKEWMKQKPLELLICGQLKTVMQRISGLPNDVANDSLVALFLMEFCQSANEILEESSGSNEATAVVNEQTSDSTEMLANSLFEEVRQHLEFLSEKSVLLATELTKPSNQRIEQTSFDTEVLSSSALKDSGVPVLPKTFKLPTAVNVEADTFNPDSGSCSALGSQVLRKREGDGNYNAKCLNREFASMPEMNLPRKIHAAAPQVQKHTLPMTEETRFESSYQPVTVGEGNAVSQFHRVTRNKEQTEESFSSENLNFGRVSCQNRWISPMQRAKGREETVTLPPKEQAAISDDLNKIETVRKIQPLVMEKKRHSPVGDLKYSSSKRSVAEHANELKSKRFKSAPKDVWSCSNMNIKDGLSEKTEEKRDPPFNAGPLASEYIRNVEKLAKYKEENLEYDQNKDRHKKEKKKGKKKKSESEELKSDLLLAKPIDSKIVLSHLLVEDSALIVGTNTDSNSSFQNSTVVENEKQVFSDNVHEQAERLFFPPETVPISVKQNIDCADIVHERTSVIPVNSNFDARSVIPETSFNLAMSLAMCEDENSGCKTDVSKNSNNPNNFSCAKTEEVATKLKPSKSDTIMTAKKTVLNSAESLLKPPVNLTPNMLSDSSSSGHLTVEKCQSLNGDAVDNLAQDAFMLFHSKMDLVFLNEHYKFGLNAAEKTNLLPLKFENKSLHYALLSQAAMKLYRQQVNGIDDSSCQPSNSVCSDHAQKPSFKSGSKRKLPNSKRESVERFKKLREVVKEKNDNIGTVDNNMDDCMDALPVTTTPITCLSTDGCADEDRDLCDIYSLTASGFDECNKVLPGIGVDIQKMDDSCIKSNTVNDKASLKETSDFGCLATNSGTLLQSSKEQSIQQQFLSAKGPRFMQTFRQNQIAKRKSQKENLRTATGGKLLHSKQPIAIGSVIKPKPIGMTLEETLAVLSGDHVSPTATTVLAPSGAVSVSPLCSDDVVASKLPVGGSLDAMTSSDNCPIEANAVSQSPVAHIVTEDLNAIPLPTSDRPEEPLGCVQNSYTAPVTLLEHVPALSLRVSASVPCEILSSSCPESDNTSVFKSETVCTANSGTWPSVFSLMPLPSDKMPREDSITVATSGAMVPPFFIPPVPPNTSPVVSPEWNCHFFPPVEAPSSYMEQMNPPPVMPHFASPRPYPMENVSLMASQPCVPHEMPARCARPAGDPRSWEGVSPMQPPFPSPAGHPWRGPWPTKNMMMPPEMTQPHFCPPPSGLNPSVVVPKRPLLPLPTGSRPGLLPHPNTLPPPPLFSPGCRDRIPVDKIAEESSTMGDRQQEQANSASDIRMYIFNKDKPICKSIERFLEFQGAHSFDPYNVGVLRNLPENICAVFVHEADLKLLHSIPNLLRLKRNIRVTFACYKDVMDIKFRNYVPLFPSAGLVIIDDAALIACKTESLQMLCDFMQLETKEKKAWTLIISPKIMEIINKIRLENSNDSDDSNRLAENKRLLDQFKAIGVVQEMSGNCLQPLTSLDYSTACRFLQTMHCKKYRHFIFVTDFPRSHPDSQLFLGSGIDIMTIPEFLKAFVGKSVDHNALATSTYSTRLTVKSFEDSCLSTAVDSITFTC